MADSNSSLTSEMQHAESHALMEFSAEVRRRVDAVLKKPTEGVLTRIPFLYTREPGARLLWNRTPMTRLQPSELLAQSRVFVARIAAMRKASNSTGEAITTVLRQLLLHNHPPAEIRTLMVQARAHVAGRPFPEFGTAYRHVLNHIQGWEKGPKHDWVEEKHKIADRELRLCWPPFVLGSRYPFAICRNYADFVEALTARRSAHVAGAKQDDQFGYLVAEHLIHYDQFRSEGATSVFDAGAPPLNALSAIFIPLVYLGQFRGQLLWLIDDRVFSQRGVDESAGWTAWREVAALLVHDQLALNANFGRSLTWVFTSELRKKLVDIIINDSDDKEALKSVFSYLWIADAVFFIHDNVHGDATVIGERFSSDASDFCQRDKWRARALTRQITDDLAVGDVGAMIRYEIAGETRLWIEIDILLGSDWLLWAGFNRVRFISPFETFAFQQHAILLALAQAPNARLHDVMSEIKRLPWNVEFDGEVRELQREIAAIGQQLKAEAERQEAYRLLASYDGIGHALRTFVEATGYRGAVEQLREVEAKELNISEKARIRLQCARRALTMFEHAEGLGSLMRLHGWVKATGAVRTQTRDKILRCFNENDLRYSKSPVNWEQDVRAGYVRLLRVLTSALSAKYDVAFDVPDFPVGASGIIAYTDSLSEISIPPLRTKGDEAAVLLALSVGLLEPLRNAVAHLSKSRRYWNPALPDPRVAIQLRAQSVHEMDAIIANPVIGAHARTEEASAIHGLRLIDMLLRQTHIAEISTIEEPQDSATMRQSEYRAYEYVWIRVRMHPRSLYEYCAQW